MKIDKVLFASSEPEEYSSFWNKQSEIFSKMGIEPVCLLFGKRSNTNMTEEFGQVIEMETLPDLPWSVQLVWSKFDYPTREPETTWLIGDIDLVPLQRAHFTTKIATVSDEAFVHLNAGGISQPRIGAMDDFLKQGPERIRKDQGKHGGSDLPGHYHVAKGKHFRIFAQDRSFFDQVKHIVSSMRYGLGPMGSKPPAEAKSNPYWHYWCAEENYTSELLWHEIQAGRIQFVPFYYSNNHNQERLQRDNWKETDKSYHWDRKLVAAQKIVDIHCCRPYKRQQEDLERIIDVSGVLTGASPIIEEEKKPLPRSKPPQPTTAPAPVPVVAEAVLVAAAKPSPIRTPKPRPTVPRHSLKIKIRNRR